MSKRFLIAFAAALLAAAHSEPSLAQFGGRGGGGFGGGYPEHVQQVVVSNAEGLDGSVVSLIADSISRRMYEETTVKEIRLQPAGARVSETMEIQLLVVAYAQSDDPQPLWEKARAELERALRRVQQRTHEARLRDQEEKTSRIHTLFREAQDRFAKVTAELAGEDSGADGDIESLRADLRKVTSHARELDLEQIGIAARRKAIEQRIDELRQRADVEVAEDAVIRELEGLVEIQERRLELIPRQSPRVLEVTGRYQDIQREISTYKDKVADKESLESDATYLRMREKLNELQALINKEINLAREEVQSNSGYEIAKADLIEARITLLKAKREASERAQGSALAGLNNELSTLTINAAEIAEKQKSIEEQIARLRERTNPQRVAELEMLKTRAELALAHLKEAEVLRAQLDRELPPVLQQITIRPLEEALLGDDAEAPPAESP